MKVLNLLITGPPVQLIPPPTATKLITFHHLRRLVCFGNCESRPSEKSQTSQPGERNRLDQKLKNFVLIQGVFIGPRCPWSDLCVRMSVSPRGFVDLTDVTLADEDTNSILTDNAIRAIPGNVRKS